jgi:phosphatidylserine decarboxylase
MIKKMSNNKINLVNLIKTAPQYILPQHLLSKMIFHLTRMEMDTKTHWLIKKFVDLYKIDMSIAEPSAIEEYSSFNEFFTRKLKADARPLAKAKIISPVDGVISQMGDIKQQQLLQAKGNYFNLNDLFGGFEQLANLFKNGKFCTIYLSPKDYHRIHMPLSGQPLDMVYVPGKLFSVNKTTSEVVSNLYARNERVINIFKTPMGPVALIMVGAIFVGSMETVWEGMITPRSLQTTSEKKKAERWQVPDNTRSLEQGDEMGRFNMGSTVILLFGKNQMEWLSTLNIGDKVLMGEALSQ